MSIHDSLLSCRIEAGSVTVLIERNPVFLLEGLFIILVRRKNFICKCSGAVFLIQEVFVIRFRIDINQQPVEIVVTVLIMHGESEIALEGLGVAVILGEDGICHRDIPAAFRVDLGKKLINFVIGVVAVL